MNNEFIFNENSSVSSYSDNLISIIENMFEGLVSIGSFGDTYTLYADNVDRLFDICFAEDYKLIKQTNESLVIEYLVPYVNTLEPK